VLWRVTPDSRPNTDLLIQTNDVDLEKEDQALLEAGVHSSGWEPSADTGFGDEMVLVQQKYDESEGPTKEDNGDSDHVVVYREDDVKNGKKFSGWTNPLSWTDDGNDDDTVLVQSKYDESEGPTKEDNGDSDHVVLYREDDVKNGKKFSGWTNPLSWTDDGNDDDTVLFMMKSNVKYDESEGPTKEDNGDSDHVVLYREDDVKNGKKFSGWTNPLSWTDDGNDDDTVL